MYLQSYVVAVCTFEMVDTTASIRGLRGTAFFVGNSGLFLTARHVIESTQSHCSGSVLKLGLAVKDQNGKSAKSMVATPNAIEFAPEPFDVAIGLAPYFPESPLKLAKKDVMVWQDVASLGYPDTALAMEGESWRLNLRAHKGYVQRTTAPPDVPIGSHPNGFELNYLLGTGMSGCPVFSFPDEVVVGVGVGSFRSEMIDDQVVETADDGREFRETRLRIEQHGFAHSLADLLDWRPSILKGNRLIDGLPA